MSDACGQLQLEELEVLRSIYEGDPAFFEVNERTFQYKVGADGERRAFLLEISWPAEYPEQRPHVSMDAFYNKHVADAVKLDVSEQVRQQADDMLGLSMTFTLFEWIKENAERLMSAQPAESACSALVDGVEALAVSSAGADQPPAAAKKIKKEQLSKTQKRRAWDRVLVGSAGERARGCDWVDVVRHLSQTGGSACET